MGRSCGKTSAIMAQIPEAGCSVRAVHCIILIPAGSEKMGECLAEGPQSFRRSYGEHVSVECGRCNAKWFYCFVLWLLRTVSRFCSSQFLSFFNDTVSIGNINTHSHTACKNMASSYEQRSHLPPLRECPS